MSERVKETLCTHCAHRQVCIYKQDYLNIIKAIENVVVEKTSIDGKGVQFKKVSDFDFISSTSIAYRYYQNWADTYRDYRGTNQ